MASRLLQAGAGGVGEGCSCLLAVPGPLSGQWSPQSLCMCGSPTQRRLPAICPGLCSPLPQAPARVLLTAHPGTHWAASWGQPRPALPLLPGLIPPPGMEAPPPQDSTVSVRAQTPPARQGGSRAADEWPRDWTPPRAGMLTSKRVPSSPRRPTNGPNGPQDGVSCR